MSSSLSGGGTTGDGSSGMSHPVSSTPSLCAAATFRLINLNNSLSLHVTDSVLAVYFTPTTKEIAGR